ncbi:PP2C family serine/threonine-protein phosphatase [Nocardioides sp. R-C-SC26]|uniref:PP2C family serine/threonine-protein phosphatase n=1 Tax=Nocardioides sp. R-C-SC26 TaxID=2870414 RepID=UPI001E527E12|nr:PP2C family serine/threonine-protein phosphatase [Nocardioides sp. R-C-SC26]
MTWSTAGAALRGSVHVRNGMPLQDSVRTWSDGERAVIVVADGHGHHQHFRSDVGADLATTIALDVLGRALTERAAVDAADWRRTTAEVVATWRAAVADHSAAQDDEEPAGLTPYGTTLLALAVDDTSVVALQIGDGDLVVVSADGEARRPLPEDPRLDGVRTSSLCQPDPLEDLRVAVFPATDVALGYVCSDGFGRARVDADWWRATGSQLLDLTRDHGIDWVRQHLPGWLEEPASVGGDDTALALLIHVHHDVG